MAFSEYMNFTIFDLKIMVKSGQIFLKLNKPLQMILLTGQANSASLADFFALGTSLISK